MRAAGIEVRGGDVEDRWIVGYLVFHRYSILNREIRYDGGYLYYSLVTSYPSPDLISKYGHLFFIFEAVGNT